MEGSGPQQPNVVTRADADAAPGAPAAASTSGVSAPLLVLEHARKAFTPGNRPATRSRLTSKSRL